MQTFRYLKNLGSYLLYYFSLDWLRLGSAVMDIFVLVWSVFNWEEVFSKKSLALIFIGVLVNFVWQVFNVVSHFRFLKKEEAKEPLTPMLKAVNGMVNYSIIQVEEELMLRSMPYERVLEMGVLRNRAIDAILESSAPIEVCEGTAKHKATRTYIKQYKDILIKFLNHKWYEVTQKGGIFTNDKKICLATELFISEGKYKWKICKGGYFDGYLTNFIFAQYVGGTHYKLFPPMNMMNSSIRSFPSSDYSDHIGVSTFLMTSDGFIIVNMQGGNAGYGANQYAPSGSGSLDYSDYHRGEDFRKMVIRGAERELGEETSLKKNMKNSGLNFEDYLTTTITCYYRDLERGGKPEFSCLTKICKPYDEIAGYLNPEANEIAAKGVSAILLTDKKSLNACIQSSSLPFKMCYYAMLEFLEKESGTELFEAKDGQYRPLG